MGRGSTTTPVDVATPELPLPTPNDLPVAVTAKAKPTAATPNRVRKRGNEASLLVTLKIEAEWKANETFATVPYPPPAPISFNIVGATGGFPKICVINAAGEMSLTTAAAGETYTFDTNWLTA